jgi:hypothetical protein
MRDLEYHFVVAGCPANRELSDQKRKRLAEASITDIANDGGPRLLRPELTVLVENCNPRSVHRTQRKVHTDEIHLGLFSWIPLPMAQLQHRRIFIKDIRRTPLPAVSELKNRDRSAGFPRSQPEASADLLGAVGAACGDVGFRFNERFTETGCCQPEVRVVFVIRRLR